MYVFTVIVSAITFPAPVVQLDDSTYILELFHGPSLAFKDFGARFMAQLMSYFNRDQDRELVILVATSGDTGGAVASGFLNTPGIKVVIGQGDVDHAWLSRIMFKDHFRFAKVEPRISEPVDGPAKLVSRGA